MDNKMTFPQPHSEAPLVGLLRTAHKVEQDVLGILRRHLEASECQDVQARLKDHLAETKWQVKLLEACLEFHHAGGEDTAEIKTAEFVTEAWHKDLLALKRLEIDLYKKIIIEARAHQVPEVVQACREILEQERAMAEWIEDSRLVIPPPVPARATA
jgi:ferritin-like metal-binding protein YciE